MTLGELCSIFASERQKWAFVWQTTDLLDQDCILRINDWLDHMRGLAVEWSVFIDGIGGPDEHVAQPRP